MEFQRWIMLIVIAGFIMAGASLALGGFQSSLVNSLTSTTVTNESQVLTNATAVALGNTYVNGVSQILVNFNGTQWGALSATEYILANTNAPSPATVTLTNNSKTGNNSRVTYTFLNSSQSVGASIANNGNLGLQNISSYFGVTGTIVGVLLLLTAVGGIIMAFTFQRD